MAKFLFVKGHSVSEETRNKIRLSKLGIKRPDMLGNKNPKYKNGLPKCNQCSKVLASYSAKSCRKHFTTKGILNWNYKGGVPPCSICGGKKSRRESNHCRDCNLKQQKGSNHPSWKGGKPNCLDCEKKLSSYDAKYCQKCVKPHVLTKEIIKKCLIRRPMSSLEIKIQSTINKYNLPYKFVGNGNFFIERKNPDFININGEKKAIEVYARKHKEKFRNNGVEGWKNDRINIFSKYGWEIIFIEDWQTNNEQTVLNLLKGGDSHF